MDIKTKQLKKLINKHHFFDKVFYLKEYRDARLADMSPFAHFLKIGFAENRKPNRDFDPEWYLDRYQDVKEQGMPAVQHFLMYGIEEGRLKGQAEGQRYDAIREQGLFDKEYYRQHYSDLSVLGPRFDLLTHFVRYGEAEGRIGRAPGTLEAANSVEPEVKSGQPAATLDAKSELSSNPEDSSARFENSADHRPEFLPAEVEGVGTDDHFDVAYYLSTNPDVAKAELDAEWHYFNFGEKEGRWPNPAFDPDFYLSLHADVRSAGRSALDHYKTAGKEEGRQCISNLEGLRRSNNLKPLLFVGHDGIQAGSEIVMLEVVRWFFEHTTRHIKILLLAPGPLANKFAQYGDIYVLANYHVDDPGALSRFLDSSFEFVYLNTVVSGRLYGFLKEIGSTLRGPVISHIHEMDKVLAEFPDEMKSLLLNTQLWISASPSTTNTLVGAYDIESSAIETIPAFINPVSDAGADDHSRKLGARAQLNIPQDALVVCGCGTVYWRKGADLFIDTARLLLEESSLSRPVYFVWIGDGPDRLELDASLNQEERKHIWLVGGKGNANELLAAADIFFLASREDPFPLVVLESAQYGIPTLCFGPATGITAFIQKDAGVALSEISSQLAAEQLKDLLSDDAKRLDLGRSAKAKLFAHYTTAVQGDRLLRSIMDKIDYSPSVSVVVPFYNHEKFVAERLSSIANQSIKDIQVVLLDDKSQDGTVEEFASCLEDARYSSVVNEENSGSPFKQWQKGLSLAQADIVWIAEGDDTCSENFLETLIPYFSDPLVNIASAKTEMINEGGELQVDALSPYLSRAYEGKFDDAYLVDGYVEVNDQFGAVCTLVNASGLLLRRSRLLGNLDEAQQFKMCGDWLIYLHCLKDGKIAYDVEAVNYFRRHSSSQVHKTEGTEVYFEERYKISTWVVENFSVTPQIVRKMFAAIDHEWDRFRQKHADHVDLVQLYDKSRILEKVQLLQPHGHVGFYVHGMMESTGGIERLAAQLANYLVQRGWEVTLYCRKLDAAEPVFPLLEAVKLKGIFDLHDEAKSIKALRESLQADKVDVFVPMLSEWLFDPIVEAAQHTGVPIIASEHNDPWKIEELWWSSERRASCFKRVEKIHLLLNRFVNSLPLELQDKAVVIPNGVELPEVSDIQSKERLILGVGRLAPQKRFDLLVALVSEIQAEMREEGYRVEIYGEGGLEEELNTQIVELGVDDLVTLKGVCSNMSEVYERASLLVVPSDFEGFSIVTVEAFAQGVPVLAFAHCNGPNELIVDGETGFLADSIEALTEIAKEIVTGMDLAPLQLHAAERAREYSLEKFYERWEKLLSETACLPVVDQHCSMPLAVATARKSRASGSDALV